MTTALLSAAADVAMRTALLAIAMALILTLFRVRASSTRHAAWTALLFAMLAMPILSRVAPSIPVTVPRPVAVRIPEQTERRDVAPLPRASSVPPTVPTVASPVETIAPPVTSSRASASRPVPWRTIAAAVYLAGAALFLIRLLMGVFHLARIGRNSRAVSADLFESSSVATPVTIGLLRPRVVLPVGWRDWPADMLAAVVAHERAHVSRRDPLIAFLARLNCALYWFHPVAWWLDRQLAVTAEHVCDDRAVTQVTRRQYAETLLEIAASARRNQGRLVWQGVGVDGDGQLGQRIDRVLTTATLPGLSRTRRGLVCASCAVLIAAAIACRQEIKAEPLREDPQVAADIKVREQESRERWALTKEVDAMTRDQAADLERVLAQNPEDTAIREKLLLFYGKNRAAEDWRYNALARRPHALWLIEHHPESELVTRARVSQREDPDGYAQARKLWLATIARPDVSPMVLTRAATFFEASEKPIAEQILLRGISKQPDGPQPRPADERSWRGQLGVMYAYAIIGARGDDPSLKWARERLEQSTDARVLYAAGYDLSWRPADEGMKQFGKQLLERASQLDPQIAQQVRTLSYQRDVVNASGAFGGRPRQEWPALLQKSTGVEKLRQLTALAESEYMSGEYFDWVSRQPENVRRTVYRDLPLTAGQEKQKAAEMLARSKTYAREAIDLAESLDGATKYPDFLFRAHIAYGLHRLREGNRDEAVEQLLAASRLTLPPVINDQERFTGGASQLEYRLVNYLLKNGERKGVVEYLERSAPHHSDPRRGEMLKSAAAIREGRMPEHYQRLVASGSL